MMVSKKEMIYITDKQQKRCVGEKHHEVFVMRSLIKDVENFPRKGVVFKDITPLLANKEKFALTMDAWASLIKLTCKSDFDKIVAIESRGFIFGSILANKLGKGLVLVRKQGKLPPPTIKQAYKLEYASARIEIKKKSIKPGERVIIVDDVIATGGTINATNKLIKKIGAKTVLITALIRLKKLYPKKVLEEIPILTIHDL